LDLKWKYFYLKEKKLENLKEYLNKYLYQISTEEYNESIKVLKSNDDILDKEQEDIEIEQNSFLTKFIK